MTKRAKRPKTLQTTVYAVQSTDDGLWWINDMDGSWGTFAEAFFDNVRPSRKGFLRKVRIVPCRVRPLTSARKNRSRTR